MRRVFLTILVAFSFISAGADNYSYLTFQKTDGSTTPVSVSGLVLTFSNGKLVASGPETSLSITLTELTKMYFSSDEQEKPDPVDNALAFSVTHVTAKMGEEFTPPTLSNPYALPVAWSSSDESVAIVESNGYVKLVSAGVTTITATFAGNDEYLAGSASYTLTVEKADPVSCELAFDQTEITVTIGEEFTSPVLLNPYDLEVEWSSSNADVATVDQQGVVALVSAGTTTIMAAFAGNDEYTAGSASYTLNVEEPYVDAINDIPSVAQRGVVVYSTSGVVVGRFVSLEEAKARLSSGVYIIKDNNTTTKFAVK